MKLKNRPIDILIGIVVAYIFLGLGVVTVQTLSGAKCGPIKLGGDYVYTVDAEAPRFWLWRAAKWLPTAYNNVILNNVSIGDYISPTECIWVPAGKTPMEVLEPKK